MLVAAALTTLAVAAVTPAAQAGVRKQMIRKINSARSWSHRHGVSFSGRLSRGASSWADYLMRRDMLAHSGSAISRGEGEIIEWHTGGRANVRKTVVEWLHSTSHRHVMLARGYRHAGAGRAVGYFGGRKCTIWVVRFAR